MNPKSEFSVVWPKGPVQVRSSGVLEQVYLTHRIHIQLFYHQLRFRSHDLRLIDISTNT